MKRFVLLLFSAGWLLPVYAAIHLFYLYLTSEVQEFIWYGKSLPRAFSYLGLSFDAMKISFGWFSMVVVYWAWCLIGKKEPTSHPQRNDLDPT